MESSNLLDVLPNVKYDISARELFKLLELEPTAELLNRLLSYERRLPYKPVFGPKTPASSTTTPRIFSTLWKKKNYFYVKLEIKESTIPSSGMGVFALEPIPKGATLR